MKKIVLLIAIPIVIILFSICGLLITKNTTNRITKEENSEYEYYLNKIVYGTDVITVIGKAVDENKKNNIKKNEKNHYIENGENSIKIEIKMLSNGKTYPMEEIYNNDITRFVQNFNLIKFKCTSIEYHKNTGKIRKMFFEETED